MNILRVFGVFFLILHCLSSCHKSDPTPNTSTTNEAKPLDTSEIQKRFKGFNLLGKFDVFWSNDGFPEEDFKMIHDLGFNFVRLPIDYLTYTEAGDWYSFNESDLKEIDNAITLGKKYGIHVNLCLHRAPGFSVNKTDKLPENQKLNLWKDSLAQNAFLKHWVMFAKRYQSISSEHLSFNLINEPADVDAVVYSTLMKKVIDSVLKYNSNRKIHIDGLDYATTPIQALVNQKSVVHALHHYQPTELTHYKANWVSGSDKWPLPQWPMYAFANGLYGSYKPELNIPLVIEGSFPTGTIISINIRQVSIKADLIIKADINTILAHNFRPASGLGEWTEVVETQWGFQNIYNKTYSAELTFPAKNISFQITDGDWLSFNKIELEIDDKLITLLPGITTWGTLPNNIKINSGGEVLLSNNNSATIGSHLLDQWEEFAKVNQTSIFVAECGVHNQTPHDVSLKYMEDMLKIMYSKKMNFALWNFRGSFGIVDSDRIDVDYEDFQGHKLDRKMLELLQKY